MKDIELTKRLNYLIDMGTVAVANKTRANYVEYISHSDYIAFKAASLSFISSVYGTEHSYYTLFKGSINETYVTTIEGALKIMGAMKHEIENGWLSGIRGLVTAQVFSDFLEMAEHLIDEGYKDAAAVMVGSVLEEQLRQLCSTYKVDTHVLKGTDNVPKKAATINEDLKKAGAYGPLQQKQVTAWLGLRNDAAHGHYGNYSKEEVTIMYQGVLNFIAEVN